MAPDSTHKSDAQSTARYRKHLQNVHTEQRDAIAARLDQFAAIWQRGDECELLKELLFCILTPQSSAHGCWETIESLEECGMLENGTEEELAPLIFKARFKNRKASYLVSARERFSGGGLRNMIDSFASEQEARRWFAETIQGIGYKEASHFLRNIGKGSSLAILDRHILRSLVKAGAIEKEPTSLGPKKYCEIEHHMQLLSRELSIPMDHLDLVLWYDAKQEIFK